jgi:hypothetical protein
MTLDIHAGARRQRAQEHAMSNAVVPDLDDQPVMKRTAGYRNTAIGLFAGIVVITLTSQAHHHFAPSQASGWRELPFYLVGGVLGYGVVCLAVLRVGRARKANSAGPMALVFGILAVLLIVPAYFTAIPFTWGAAAVLLSRDATPGRTRTASTVLGVVAMLAMIAVLVYRFFGGLAQT